MVKREAIRGAAIGMVSAALSYGIVSYTGFGWKSLSAIAYLQVLLAATVGVAASRELLSTRIGRILDRVVLVVEGEELRMKKLLSGEKYRVRGELEKL